METKRNSAGFLDFQDCLGLLWSLAVACSVCKFSGSRPVCSSVQFCSVMECVQEGKYTERLKNECTI